MLQVGKLRHRTAKQLRSLGRQQVGKGKICTQVARARVQALYSVRDLTLSGSQGASAGSHERENRVTSGLYQDLAGGGKPRGSGEAWRLKQGKVETVVPGPGLGRRKQDAGRARSPGLAGGGAHVSNWATQCPLPLLLITTSPNSRWRTSALSLTVQATWTLSLLRAGHLEHHFPPAAGGWIRGDCKDRRAHV